SAQVHLSGLHGLSGSPERGSLRANPHGPAPACGEVCLRQEPLQAVARTSKPLKVPAPSPISTTRLTREAGGPAAQSRSISSTAVLPPRNTASTEPSRRL